VVEETCIKPFKQSAGLLNGATLKNKIVQVQRTGNTTIQLAISDWQLAISEDN